MLFFYSDKLFVPTVDELQARHLNKPFECNCPGQGMSNEILAWLESIIIFKIYSTSFWLCRFILGNNTILLQPHIISEFIQCSSNRAIVWNNNLKFMTQRGCRLMTSVSHTALISETTKTIQVYKCKFATTKVRLFLD